MPSETTKGIVMDESTDGKERFKALVGELYWVKKLSTVKAAEKLKVRRQKTLWNIKIRNKKTAL